MRTATAEIPKISDEDIEWAIRIYPDARPMPIRIRLPNRNLLRVFPKEDNLSQDQRHAVASETGNPFHPFRTASILDTLLFRTPKGKDPFRRFQIIDLVEARKAVWYIGMGILLAFVSTATLSVFWPLDSYPVTATTISAVISVLAAKKAVSLIGKFAKKIEAERDQQYSILQKFYKARWVHILKGIEPAEYFYKQISSDLALDQGLSGKEEEKIFQRILGDAAKMEERYLEEIQNENGFPKPENLDAPGSKHTVATRIIMK